MDLHEDKEKNLVTATFEFPGVSKENIQIDVHNGRLTVAAETKQSSDFEGSGYAVRERQFGQFTRTLQLPQGIKVCSLLIRSIEQSLNLFRRTRKSKPLWTTVFWRSPSRKQRQSLPLSTLLFLKRNCTFDPSILHTPPFPWFVFFRTLFGIFVTCSLLKGFI